MAKLSQELAGLRKVHPDREEIRILQAILAVNQKRYDEAEKELEQAIKECATTLRSELQLAWLYQRTDRLVKGIDICRAACTRHPETGSAWQALSAAEN